MLLLLVERSGNVHVGNPKLVLSGTLLSVSVALPILHVSQEWNHTVWDLLCQALPLSMRSSFTPGVSVLSSSWLENFLL